MEQGNKAMGVMTEGMMEKAGPDPAAVSSGRIPAYTKHQRKSLAFLGLLEGDLVYILMLMLLLLNALQELLVLIFYYNTTYPQIGMLVLVVCGLIYVIEALMRVVALKSFFYRSVSNIMDVVLSFLIAAAIAVRYLNKDKMHDQYNGMLKASIIVTMALYATKIVIKRWGPTVSMSLLEFTEVDEEEDLLISIDSLRQIIFALPDLHPASLLKLENEVAIVCGRNHGMMSSAEFMVFLERALPLRPPGMTATEFLSFMLNVGMGASRNLYSTYDVVRSTLWHWSFQMCDMVMAIIVVCVKSAVPPAQAKIFQYLTDNALSNATNNKADNSILTTGVAVLLAISIPYVLSTLPGIGYYQSKMISNSIRRIQHQLADIILHQDNKFFMMHSEGD